MYSLIRHLWGDRFEILGSENIPRSGSAVLAINQTTHLDPLFLAIAVRRPIHFVGLDDHGDLEPWYTPLLYDSMGVIRVTRNLALNGGHHFMAEVDDAARYGELIGIFPEGRLELKQNRREIAPFHIGAVTIARRHRLPIIPILMQGMEEVIPHSTAHLREKIHLAPITIVIGEALAPESWCNEEDLRQAVINLRNAPRAARRPIPERVAPWQVRLFRRP